MTSSMNKLLIVDIIEALDKELQHRYSRFYRMESPHYTEFEKGVDAGIRDARQAMITVLQSSKHRLEEK